MKEIRTILLLLKCGHYLQAGTTVTLGSVVWCELCHADVYVDER